MATVTAGNSYSQSVSADQTIAISVSHNSSGRIRFTPINTEGLPVDAGSGIGFGPLAMSKTFGPWGQAGTVTIFCDVGTVTYTINPPTFYDNPVLSGGTANGVAYLNGSKVLTSGSALTFDGTNLGVGTASPSGAAGTTFAVNGGASQARLALKNTASGDASTDGFQIALLADGVNVVYQNRESGYQAWELAGSEGMRLITTGLGIGTNSPSVRLQLEQAENSAPVTLLRLNNSGTTAGGPGIASRISFTAGNTALGFIQGSNFASGAAGLQFSGDGTNAQVTLDSFGNLLIGTTSAGLSNSNSWNVYTANNAIVYQSHANGVGSGTSYTNFGYNGGVIGSITQSGTTAVAYNTASDYRLKENVEPMQNALTTVAQLKPVTYIWKADGSAGQGFIAHELQAVVPDCVTGEKDATRIEQYVVEPEKKVKVTKQRQVTDKTIITEEQIVLIDGKHVLRMVEKVVDQPLFETQPVFDEAGNPVMVLVSAEERDENGNVIKDAVFAQRTTAVPVMEEYEDEETVPAVMGEREVPAYQGVDTSFLVATLTAAIQELTQQVNTLKAKVGA